MAEQVGSAEVVRVLEREGPRTGAELLARTGLAPLPLWRACRADPSIRFEVVGRRFLRLDKAVDGYARLSPSIRREFLTYTLLGLTSQARLVEERAALLRQELERVSRYKLELARDTMQGVVAELATREAVATQVCFLMAGDVTYGMSHVVPRPEPSTGKLVRGSDLDVIAVATDELPEEALRELDATLHRTKRYLLVHPGYQEEIDYVVKRLAKVREQLRFDGFRAMVACKILHESRFLCGSEELFRTVKEQVEAHGIPSRLAALEAQAVETRAAAEHALLTASAGPPDEQRLYLFYTREERDEIF